MKFEWWMVWLTLSIIIIAGVTYLGYYKYQEAKAEGDKRASGTMANLELKTKLTDYANLMKTGKDCDTIHEYVVNDLMDDDYNPLPSFTIY